MVQRSLSVTIVGLLFCLFGLLAVFVNTYTLVTLISYDSQKYLPSEMTEELNKTIEKEDHFITFKDFSIAGIAIIWGALAAFFGFEFFRMKEYARKGLIGVSLVLLAFSLYIGIGVFVSFSQYHGSDASSFQMIGYLALAGNFFLLFLLIRFLFRVNFKETG